MHLGFSLTPFGHHPSAWRETPQVEQLGFDALLSQVAQADAAGLDFVLLSDRLGARPIDTLSPVATPIEPTLLVAALATKASRIGFLAAAATGQHEPYNLARRFASLDQISNGRCGWIVLPTAGQFARDREYVELVNGLWDSWEDDAFVYDKAQGRFFAPEKMHVLHHRGEHFSVRGPLNVNRSAQGRPVIAQILAAETRVLAAHAAEVVFLQENSHASTAEALGEFLRTLEAVNRPRSDLRLLANVLPFVADTHAEAQALHDRMLDESGVRAESLPGISLIGSPAEISEALETSFRTSGLDGFTILPPTLAAANVFFTAVIPEMRQKGLINETAGATLRDHLALSRPSHPATRQEHAS